MIYKLFSIFDSKVGVYAAPFPALTEEQAKRIFFDMCDRSDNAYGKHPADYTLFYVADCDDAKGIITSLVAFENLGNGMVLLAETKSLESND